MANLTISGTFHVSSSMGLLQATSSSIVFSSASIFGIGGTVTGISATSKNVLQIVNSTFGYVQASVRPQPLLTVSGPSILNIVISDSVFEGLMGNASAFIADVPNAVISISGSAFRNNSFVATNSYSSSCLGAGLLVHQCNQISVSGSDFSDNWLNFSDVSAATIEASWFGGAAFAVLNVTSGIAIVENSTFVRNTVNIVLQRDPITGVSNQPDVSIGGAGLWLHSAAPLSDIRLASCLFELNSVQLTVSGDTDSVSLAGGALALFVDSPTLVLHAEGITAHSNALRYESDTATVNATLSVGGGVLGVVLSQTVQQTSIDIIGFAATGNSVTTALTVEGGRIGGGGAMLLFNTQAPCSLLLNATDWQMSENSVSVTGTTTASERMVGGGALYINNPFNASFMAVDATLQSSTFINNALDVTAPSTAYSHNCGGAVHIDGGYAVSETAPPVTVRVINCTLTGNSLGAPAAPVSRDTINGGGGLYLNSAGAVTVEILSSTIANTVVNVTSLTAANGVIRSGGAVLVRGSSVFASLRSSQFLANTGNYDQHFSGARNQNGGSGVYLLAELGDVNLQVDGCQFVANQMTALSNSATNPNTGEEFVGNQNGGAAIYGNAYRHMTVTVTSSIIAQSVAECSSSASNSSLHDYSGNSNGGALLLLANSGQFNGTFTNTSFTDNFLRADNATTISDYGNANGGASVYVSSFANATLLLSGVVMSDNTFSGRYGWSATNNKNGAAGLYISSVAGVQLTATDCVFERNVVVVDNTVALVSDPDSTAGTALTDFNGNQNGGASIFVTASQAIAFAATNLSVQYCTTSSNHAQVLGNSTLASNQNGGAVFMTTETDTLTVTIVNSLFRNNSLSAVNSYSNSNRLRANSNGGSSLRLLGNTTTVTLQQITVEQDLVISSDGQATASGNSNGGSLYIAAEGDFSLSVSDSTLADNCLNAANNTAFTFNANGGAALYVFSNDDLTYSLRNVSVLRNVVRGEATATVALAPTGYGNFNGGAVYLFSVDVTKGTLTDSFFDANVVHFQGSVTAGAYGNNNGGAAFFLHGRSDAILTLQSSLVQRNLVVVSDCHSYSSGEDASNANGGAFYLISVLESVYLTMNNSVLFTQNSLVSSRTTAANLNQNGGSAIYVNSEVSAYANISGLQCSNNTLTVSSSSSGHSQEPGTNNGNGGGCMYLTANSTVVTLFQSVISDNRLTATGSFAKHNRNGAAGVYISAPHIQFASTDDLYSGNVAIFAADASKVIESGGAALYLLGTTQDQSNECVISGSRFFNNSVRISDCPQLHQSQVGGGAMYSNSETDSTLSLINTVFDSNTVSITRVAVTDCGADGGGALYNNCKRNCYLALTAITATNNSASLETTSASSINFGGGAVFAFSRGTTGSNTVVTANCTLQANCVAVSDIQGKTGFVIGGGALQAFSLTGASSLFTSSQNVFAQNTAVGRNLSVTQSLADVYFGGGAVLVSSLTANSTVSFAATNITQSLVQLDTAQSSVGNVYAGGGGVIVLGATAATATLQQSTLSDNSVFSRGAVANNGQVSVGGGALMAWTLDTAEQDSITLAVAESQFANNSARTLQSSCELMRSGGGAIFISTEYAQLNFSLLASRFERNSVSSEIIAADRTELGGGAILVYDTKPCLHSASVCANIAECYFGYNTAVTGGFNSQTDSGGGALWNSLGSDLRISHSQFVGNNASSNAGGGILSLLSRANFDTVTLTGNSANLGGGMKISSTVLAHNLIVDSNYAISLGGGVFLTGRESHLLSCVFTNNAAAVFGGGVYAALEAQAVFHNSTFAGNTAAGGGALAAVDEVDITLSAANATANTATSLNGGALLALILGRVTLYDSVFSANSAPSGRGGAIAALHVSNVSVDQSSFSRSSSTQGGWLFATDLATVSVTNSNVSTATSTVHGGGAMCLQTRSSVTVSDSVFSGCHSHGSNSGGGVASLQDTAQLTLTSVDVMENQADMDGGAIKLRDESMFSAVATVFRNNSAGRSGGAIFSEAARAPKLTNNTLFEYNAAQLGGAVFLVCSDDISSVNSTLDWSVSFRHNFAVAPVTTAALNPNGGAGSVFWDLSQLATPNAVTPAIQASAQYLSSLVAESGVAVYGDNFATSWFSLRIVSVSRTTGGGKNVSALASGDVLSVQLVPVDLFGNVITTLSNELVAVSCDPADSCADSGIILLNNGKSTYSSALYGKENQRVTLTFSPQISSDDVVSVSLSVQLSACAAGDGITGRVCETCHSGTYTLNPRYMCYPCPPTPSGSALCLGGTSAYIASDFWPFVDTHTGNISVYACPFDFCEGRPGNATLLGLSDWAYLYDKSTWCKNNSNRDPDSLLCGACAANYSDWSHTCLACGADEQNGPAVAWTLFFMFLVIMVQHLFGQSITSRSAFTSTVFIYQFSDLSLYPQSLETFANVFALEWPAYFVTRLSHVCPFYVTPEGGVWVQFAMPFLYLVMLLALYVLHVSVGYLLTRPTVLQRAPRLAAVGDRIYHWASGDHYTPTLIVMIINSYESLLSTIRGVLDTVPNPDPTGTLTRILKEYPAVQDPLSLTVFAYFLLAFLLLLPIASGSVLLYFWRSGRLVELEGRFGQYFSEYKESCCFWESFLLLRRAILLGAFVAADKSNLGNVVLLFVLLISIGLQLIVRPHKHSTSNLLEVFTLSTTAVVVGIYTVPALRKQPGMVTINTISQVTLAVAGLILHTPVIRQLWDKATSLLLEYRLSAKRRQRLQSAQSLLSENSTHMMQVKLLRSASGRRSLQLTDDDRIL